MRINALAMATMALAACIVASGCLVMGPLHGVPAGTDPELSTTLFEGVGSLGHDEALAMSRAEEMRQLEEFEGGYYYGAGPYMSGGETLVWTLLGVAMLAGLIVLMDEYADEAHIHTDNVDIIMTNGN